MSDYASDIAEQIAAEFPVLIEGGERADLLDMLALAAKRGYVTGYGVAAGVSL